MASEGAGKAKSKRYNEHGKPYERRRSIIGIVTDTMKGIFKSSWSSQDEAIAKASTSSQEGNGRPDHNPHNNVQHKHALNSHGIDSNLGQSYIQPPSSAPSLQGQAKQVPMGIPQMPIQTMTRPEAGNYPSEHIPFMQYQSKPANIIVNGSDDRSELSECSMSNVPSSSLGQHQDKKDMAYRDLVRHQDSRIHQMRQELGGSVTPSKELEAQSAQSIGLKDMKKHNERSFLWSGQSPSSNTSISRPQPSAKKKPSFNVSIFGSSVSSDKSVSLGNGHNDSLFYSGKTSFGGASSQKKRKLQETSPPQLTPNKRQVRAKPLTSNTSGISSSSARRILSTLERMSSPLNDVKKIPSYNSSLADSPLSFTPSSFGSAARKRTLNYRSSSAGVLKGPPVHALSTPGTVQIAKNYHTPSYFNVSSHDGTPKSSSSSSPFKPSSSSASCAVAPSVTESYADAGGTRSGKMKHSRGQHYSSKREEDEVLEVPQLSTNFTLPVSDMPKLDFKPSSSSTLSKPKPASGNGGEFTFSTPIHKSQPSSLPKAMTGQNFQFSSPINVEMSTTGKVSASEQGLAGSVAMNRGDAGSQPALPKPDLGFKFNPTTAKRKSIESAPAPTFGDVDAPVTTPSPIQQKGSFTPASELKMGSVMDILGGSKKTTVEKTKTATETTAPPPASTGSSLSDLFKKPTGSWECPMCMIQNKSDVAACVACETAKPGAAEAKKPEPIKPPPSYSAPDIPIENSLAAQFKKPEGSWECDTCMVTNNGAATKCIACETSKPGIKKTTSFTSAGGFKIGPKGGLQLDGISTDAAGSKPAGGFQVDKLASASLKGDSTPAAGGFKFGASLSSETDSKNSNGGFKIADSSEKNDSGFKFGASLSASEPPNKSGASLPNSNFTFGAAKSSDDQQKASEKESAQSEKKDIKDSTVQSTGGFKFGQSLSNTEKKADNKDSAPPATGGFTFGQSISSSDNKNTSVSSTGGIAFGAPTEVSKPKEESKTQQTPGIGLFGSAATSNVSSTVSQAETKATVTFNAGSNSIKPQSTAAPSGTAGFSFGLSDPKPSFNAATAIKKVSPSPSPAPASTFMFGQQPKDQPSSGFALGTAPKTENGVTENKPALGGFSFNSKPADAAAAKPAEAAPSSGAGLFAFGATTKPAESVSQQTAAAPFAFDAKPSQPAASATPQSSLFTFGTGPKAATNTAAATQPPAFNFTASSTTATPKPATTGPTAPASSGNNMFSFNAKPGQLMGQNPFGPVTNATPSLFTISEEPGAQFGTKAAVPDGSLGSSILGKRSGTMAEPEVAVNSLFGDVKKNKDISMSTEDVKFYLPQNSSGFNLTAANTTSNETAPAFSFGQQNSQTTTTAPFGAQTTSSSSTSFGGFTKSASTPAFGAMTKTSTANMFGNNTNTATPSFGASTNVPSFGTPTTNAAAAPAAFGGFGATPSTAPAFGSTTTSTASTPAFGTTNSTPGFGSAAPPAFGAATTSAPAPAFGSTATTSAPPAFGATSTNSSATFGSTSTNNTGFQFGGQAAPQASQQPSAAGVFQFGQSAPPSQPASTGFNFGQAPQASAQSGFNFNAQNAASPPPANFAFNAPPAAVTPNANPFSMTGTPASSSRRVKKAVRKIRK